MRWTAAWLLALAVHLAVVGAVWLGCRAGDRAPRRLVETVELAVIEQAPAPPPNRSKQVDVNEHVDVPEHDHGHDHGGGHVRVHGHDQGGGHENGHEHPSVREPVIVDEPVAVDEHLNGTAPTGVAAPVAGPIRAPVDFNLNHDSLAALASPPVAPEGSAAGSLDTSTLHGAISGDGTMHVRSKRPVTVGSDLTQPGSVLKDWLKDPKAHAAARDGTVAIVQGTFDVTDSIMRAHGQDPYRAQRMKMLDETREQRLTLAAQATTARRQAELAALPAELRNIWNDGARSAKERRQVVFQLWDECQEPAEGEAEGSEAGARARREIVLFIRERLADGSPEGYPKGEIATLNLARQSRQRFDPYGRSPL